MNTPTLSELEARAGKAQPAFGESAHILCDNLVRIYKTEGVEVVALQGLDLLIEEGELIAIVGASGSGKSTLLNVLSGLDVPTAGLARVAGTDLLAMSAKDRLRYRREVVGFIWQQTARNLLPYLTARENVELPVRLAGVRDRKAAAADDLLELLGVGYCADRRPAQMSGGEQQRVAIAVALANAPQVILADEPTGELDSENSEQVFAALRRANRELGVTAVVVTHDPLVSEQVDRTVGIRDGRTSSETLRREGSDGGIIAEEYAVLDRVGRLQLPRDFTQALNMERRVRLELERDHIGVWPDRPRAEDEE
ncbi:ABC transporter ATP-binding protein [Sphaerisporangium siamense]|uniref:ABC-type lipoprotein export system ATPase subunit n=1 Tax=Sphaerisporangium siamense TaxID=795645 RepID=A0A7W7DHB9_9ACTN|nr:ABC transporter ATP-binding protein [Sphaerisporangium siamense]MBB4705333.1 ABC-type lipoprotein export system ATPase subunit [Sphaerisporangium siamense]GII86514.1 ABC transporter ATP-binding protein [Sphaerisporangium siamense]